MSHHPYCVSYSDALDVREEKIPSQLHETSLFRAKCIQRKRVITDRERLVFAIPGMRHVSYMHRDDATCWANLTSKDKGRCDSTGAQ